MGNRIAQTIAAQMGGTGKLALMVNAKNFADCGDGLSFKFSAAKRSLGNIVKVEYNKGTDSYDMIFYTVSIKEGVVERGLYQDIYCDMLKGIFESHTGLYLSLN